jgi:hypothetical protein
MFPSRCPAPLRFGRLSEAGLGEETLGAGGPLLSKALRWAIAAVIVVATGMRYSHHASDEVRAMPGGGGRGPTGAMLQQALQQGGFDV